MRHIGSLADIRAVEAIGYAEFCPHASPWGIISASAEKWPDNTALHYLEDASDPRRDRTWTYAELRADVVAAARVFRGFGVKPGRSVAILANHTPSAQIALWAAGMAGCAAPMNPLLRPEHIAALLKATKAAVVVMMGINDELDYWSSLVPALREAGVDLPIIDCDSDGRSPGSSGTFETLLVAERDKPLGFEISGGDENVVALYHTGGTTGAPKLVQHTRRNEAHVARSCALLHDYGSNDVVANGFPLFHVAGAFVYGLSALSEGSKILIPGRLGMRNPEFIATLWKQVERHRITIIAAVPTILSGLVGKPVDADISTARAALTGGSPLPTELASAFEQKIGIPVRNIFGMTETSGSIALESVHTQRTPNCCGYPLPFTQVAILEPGCDLPDPTQTVPAGVVGLVACRGPNVSPGYTETALNAGTFLTDGWLITGDLGSMDAEGRLYLTGRAKDVIIRGSHNIDPQSIEDTLLAHPDIEMAAAVGMPDNYSGELPVAFVTIREGAHLSCDEIIEFLKHRIEDPTALPKRIEIIAAMPVTAVGKIFKPTLRREAIGWAITTAAAKVGIPDRAWALDVGETLTARIAIEAAHAVAMRDAVLGMPITIEFTDLTEVSK